MNVTTTDRNIDSLHPTAQTAIKLLFQECHKAGIDIFVTETFRSQARQNYLYEQGRTRSGKIVTWTKSSRHTSKLAWDIAASTLKGNKDIYNVSILKKAGAIANKLNITWGGNWKNNIDYPHFEVSTSWTIPKGYKLEGKVSIPTSSNKPISIVSDKNKLPQVELTVNDNKNNTVLDKGVEEELKFTSATLEKELDKLVNNPTSRKQIIDRAVKELGYSESWKTKKDVADGDILSMALSLALKK